MGEIADSLINGEFCEQCGVYLDPGEKVYTQVGDQVTMPTDGEGFGIPVNCKSCGQEDNSGAGTQDDINWD